VLYPQFMLNLRLKWCIYIYNRRISSSLTPHNPLCLTVIENCDINTLVCSYILRNVISIQDGNVFGHVCVSVFLVRALTFESLDL